MRNFHGNYSVVATNGGEVICFERGNRREFLGTDGLWHRVPDYCDAFTEAGAAATLITKLQEEDERR